MGDELSFCTGHNATSSLTTFAPHLRAIQVRPVVSLDPIGKSLTVVSRIGIIFFFF